MSSNKYCENPPLPLNVRDEEKLIKIVARQVEVSEEKLHEALQSVKNGWYRGKLTYWQVYDIASNLKRKINH